MKDLKESITSSTSTGKAYQIKRNKDVCKRLVSGAYELDAGRRVGGVCYDYFGNEVIVGDLVIFKTNNTHGFVPCVVIQLWDELWSESEEQANIKDDDYILLYSGEKNSTIGCRLSSIIRIEKI